MKEPMNEPVEARRNLFLLLFGGLATWGILVASGAVIYGGFDWRKALVILGCVAGFLASWGLLLLRRARR